MQKVRQKPLSEVQKEPTPAERMEQAITDLEIEAIEREVEMTEMEISIMELQTAAEREA